MARDSLASSDPKTMLDLAPSFSSLFISGKIDTFGRPSTVGGCLSSQVYAHSAFDINGSGAFYRLQ